MKMQEEEMKHKRNIDGSIFGEKVEPVKEELKRPMDSFLAPTRHEKASHDSDIEESGGRYVVQDRRAP